MDILRRILSKVTNSYLIKKTVGKEANGKVLMFHSIGGAEDEFNISVGEFEKVLERLKWKNVINLPNWEQEKDFIALTVDDVPETFYKYAFPLLKEHNIPFTIFVSTSLLDKEGFITTAQLKDMVAYPLCTVGSHGHNHGYYCKMTESEAMDDLQSSKKRLESIIGKSVIMYAFPYGSYFACGFTNKHLVSDVYQYGFGTIATLFTKKKILPNYFLPRVNVVSNNISEVI